MDNATDMIQSKTLTETQTDRVYHLDIKQRLTYLITAHLYE